jgi:hypothetical protein
MTAYGVEQARRDLSWLQEVRAVRNVEERPDGAGFVVELPTRQTIDLTVAAVSALKAGVLAGWRLPRGVGQVPG